MIIRLKSNMRLLEVHFPESIAEEIAAELGTIDLEALGAPLFVQREVHEALHRLGWTKFAESHAATVRRMSRAGKAQELVTRARAGDCCPSWASDEQKAFYRFFIDERIRRGRILPDPPEGPPPRTTKPSKFVGYVVTAGIVAFTATLVIIFGVTK